MFQVGDKVTMSEIGMEEYEDCDVNPHETTGLVTHVDLDEEGRSISVNWSNGQTNVYYTDELDLIHGATSPFVKGKFKEFARAKL